MKNAITNWSFVVAALLFIIRQSHSSIEFRCLESKGLGIPELPSSYSTNMRINFFNGGNSIEAKYVTAENGAKDFLEIKKKNRYVKYINRGDQKSVLMINYIEDEGPKCTVKKSLDVTKFMDLDSEDSGPSNIISLFFKARSYPKLFSIASPEEENGMAVLRWEACLKDPRINVSYSFAPVGWSQPYTSSLMPDANYLVSAYAEIDKVKMNVLFSNFDPRYPDEAVFQPPEDVYCEGFRTDKKPPKMPDFFSYNSEILTYESAGGISPFLVNRKVFYDKTGNISRMDMDEPLADNPDIFSPISGYEMSLIHDFNAGVQYNINPVTGKCETGQIRNTPNVVYNLNDKSNVMASGDEFFLLDVSQSSYNGQFPIRGMMAHVYTAKKINPVTKENTIISWYFAKEETRIVEKENVEKDVLLRMSIRPETKFGKSGVTEINFFNFAKSQPSAQTYDLSGCFNESSVQFMVLTFPADDLLRGYEKFVGKVLNIHLSKFLGISKQRIFIREVIFSDKYMYAEFDLLDVPPFLNPNFKELSLKNAVNTLQGIVSRGEFSVNVTLEKNVVFLKPEPNGLNVFAGDRDVKPSVIGYKEGSVIGLTIGMLFLGVILGGMTLNLIISRKFGVSLFQISSSGNEPFSNRLDESSI